MKIIEAKWNPYIKETSDEFVTISEYKYHYWQLNHDLRLFYQQGHEPKGYAASCRELKKKMTTFTFCEPMYE